jgi:hypothetical protein
MSAINLIRWCGLATIVAGVFEALVAVMEFLFIPRGTPFSAQAATNVWLVQQVLNWSAKFLLLLTLIALYSRQASRAGRFGLVAFVVAFTGTAFFFATIWGFFILAPGLATAAPQVLDSTVAFMGSTGTQPSILPGLVGLLLPFALITVGWLLFVLASLRANVFPRLAFVLIVIGLPVRFLGLSLVADMLFGAGLVWLGSALWSNNATAARSATASDSPSAA